MAGLLVWLGCLAVACSLYQGVWRNGFYKDDYQWIADARDIVRHPVALVRPHPDNSEFVVRQTQRLLFATIYRFAGTRPAAYYAAGLILHALAAALLFPVVRALVRLRDPDAGKLATVFAPAASAVYFASTSHHASAVLWIAAQSSILVTIALELLFWYVTVNATRLAVRRVALTAAGLFVVALYSKNVAATFRWFWRHSCSAWRPRARRPASGGRGSSGSRDGESRAGAGLVHEGHPWRRARGGCVVGARRRGLPARSQRPANLAGTFLSCFVSPQRTNAGSRLACRIRSRRWGCLRSASPQRGAPATGAKCSSAWCGFSLSHCRRRSSTTCSTPRFSRPSTATRIPPWLER
jgi:hypothetical protein